MPPRHRLVFLATVMSLAFGALTWRLADVQVASSHRYAVFGESQRLRSAVLPGPRGPILDRNGAELALSVRGRTVWADPRAVVDPAGTARRLAPILDIPEDRLRERLSSRASFVYLGRKLDDSVADAVAALKLPGVGLLDDLRRYSPGGELAAPVLGKVGVDDRGLSGLERQYEEDLGGRPGELVVERDPAGRPIAAGIRQVKEPVPGRTLQLTIDRTMQFETERALAEQITASRARGGIAVVMHPATGEILAMANLVATAGGSDRGAVPRPSADNMAVTRVYEPGSVNKVVTIAGALEDGRIDTSQRMNVPDSMRVADVTFRDAEPHPPGWWSLPEIVAESSNVGTIMVAQRLGRDRIDHYLRTFGLADGTGLGFPGESGGLLPDRADWTGTSIATLPIGQGVAVTALQMLGVYNAIANDGVWVAPKLVKGVTDESGQERLSPESRQRRVVSAETARTVRSMLVGAVREGTGTAAAIPGYEVAGKTGTARKPLQGAVGYKEGAYVASFVGLVPASAPQLSAIVALDEPTPYYGGLVAAPLFKSVAGYGLRHFRVPPEAPARRAAPGAATVRAAATLGSPPTARD